jgi:hypothetical protein
MDLLAQVQRDRGLEVKKPPSAPAAKVHLGTKGNQTPGKSQKKPTRAAPNRRKA